MSAYSDAAALAQDPLFRERVKMAMVKAARDIGSETDTGKVAHVKRVARAISILNTPEQRLEAYAWAVAANPSITSAATDSDIQFTINSVYDSLAGVLASDQTTDYNPPLVTVNLPYIP